MIMSYKSNINYLKTAAKNVNSETSDGAYRTIRYYLRKIAEGTTGLPSADDFDTVEATITYTDATSETVELYIKPTGD